MWNSTDLKVVKLLNCYVRCSALYVLVMQKERMLINSFAVLSLRLEVGLILQMCCILDAHILKGSSTHITKSEALCNRSYFITSIHQESKILDVI